MNGKMKTKRERREKEGKKKKVPALSARREKQVRDNLF